MNQENIEGINDLEKGKKRAPDGTIVIRGGREWIQTPDGWKYHGSGKKGWKQSSSKKDSSQRDQSPSPESEAIAKEKMGDIDRRFKAFAMFTKQVISGMSKSMIAYGTGGVGKTYTVTQQLLAAGKKEFDQEENAPGDDTYDYVKITGKMTAPQVYKTLYEHNGKIILFDDCDSVLRDGNAVNLFKGALDTSGDGTIAYSTSSGVKSSEDENGESVKLPPRFKFTGSVMFISNLPPDQVPQPLKSRALKVDLTMTKQQTINRIRQIATNPTTGQMTNLKFPGISKYTSKDMGAVVDYLDQNKDHIGDLNVRTVGKMLGIKLQADSMDMSDAWKEIADQELFSKSEDFFNGGLMKANKQFISSLYKSNSPVKKKSKIKSEDVKSEINISEDQLKTAGIDEDDFEEQNDSEEKGDLEQNKQSSDKDAVVEKSLSNALNILIK